MPPPTARATTPPAHPAPPAPPAPVGRRAAPLPPDERRAAIVRAAIPLVVEHGEAVTTRQLAQAAGVAEGTIFNVFADKDELLAAVLAATIDQEPLERAVRAIDPGLPFEERLVAATRLLQRRTVEIWRVVSALGPRHHRPDGPLPDSPALAELFAPAPDLAVTPTEAARLLRALTLSLTHPMLMARPAGAERVVDVLLHGIGPAR